MCCRKWLPQPASVFAIAAPARDCALSGTRCACGGTRHRPRAQHGCSRRWARAFRGRARVRCCWAATSGTDKTRRTHWAAHAVPFAGREPLGQQQGSGIGPTKLAALVGGDCNAPSPAMCEGAARRTPPAAAQLAPANPARPSPCSPCSSRLIAPPQRSTHTPHRLRCTSGRRNTAHNPSTEGAAQKDTPTAAASTPNMRKRGPRHNNLKPDMVPISGAVAHLLVQRANAHLAHLAHGGGMRATLPGAPLSTRLRQRAGLP